VNNWWGKFFNVKERKVRIVIGWISVVAGCAVGMPLYMLRRFDYDFFLSEYDLKTCYFIGIISTVSIALVLHPIFCGIYNLICAIFGGAKDKSGNENLAGDSSGLVAVVKNESVKNMAAKPDLTHSIQQQCDDITCCRANMTYPVGVEKSTGDDSYGAYLKKQSSDDLQSILNSINKMAHPARYAMVIAEIEVRDKLPKPQPDELDHRKRLSRLPILSLCIMIIGTTMTIQHSAQHTVTRMVCFAIMVGALAVGFVISGKTNNQGK